MFRVRLAGALGVHGGALAASRARYRLATTLRLVAALHLVAALRLAGTLERC